MKIKEPITQNTYDPAGPKFYFEGETKRNTAVTARQEETKGNVYQELAKEREQRLIVEQLLMESRPRQTYYDLVLKDDSLMNTKEIAEDYGKTRQWLDIKLSRLGVHYKQGSTWLLYKTHADKGYTYSTTNISDKEPCHLFTKWTQKGRLFIYDLLKSEGILPLIEKGTGE